jgi:hypothetical protein
MSEISVFISYSHKDKEIANQIILALKDLSLDYFIDEEGIKWGEPINEEIEENLKHSTHQIVIATKSSINSHWVPYEIGIARGLSLTENVDIKILPFLSGPKIDLPDYLRKLKYIDSIEKLKGYFKDELKELPGLLPSLLSMPINEKTLSAYTKLKYPDLKASNVWQTRMLKDLNPEKYRKIKDIDLAVDSTKAAVDKYSKDKPELFKSGTGFITKSLGFFDPDFRRKHPFGKSSIDAFNKYKELIKKV